MTAVLRRRWRLAAAAAATVGFVQYDRKYCYARATRNIRSFYAAAWTLYEYKINWKKAETAQAKSSIHDRVARRWYEVCCKNGGLYIKIGQSVTTLAHVLPPEYLKYFSNLHDQAPQADYEDVESILSEELGVNISEDPRFESFEPVAIASASIAQVHKATLKDGAEVAVKIQKPWIRKQLPFDLACYRLLVFLLEKAFDLPMFWTTKTVCDVITNEADFRVEAENSRRAAVGWKSATRDLANRVHVPKVFDDLSTERVLTQEWIDGIKINDIGRLEHDGFDRKEIAQVMIAMFADQIFRTGFIHGDPHPGNILVRRHPSNNSLQMVCLDHGMYQDFTEAFRVSYSELWCAICTSDEETMNRVCDAWGIADSELFATMQLLKPFSKKKAAHIKSTSRMEILQHTLDMQTHGYDRIKRMLRDSELVPREFVFLGR